MGSLLNNRSAVITGAASGIGEATARLFSENGAKVLAFDLDPSVATKFNNVDSISGIQLDISSDKAPVPTNIYPISVTFDTSQLDIS